MALYYANQYVTTTLSKVGGLNATDTTGIVLASTDGVDTSNPGIALLSYQDPLDTSKAEWITYTSINGSKELVGVARAQEGSTAKTHSDGCAIAFPLSKSHINNINTAMVLEHDNTGHHSGVGIYNSLYRQALINGNFDVWQRGTSIVDFSSAKYTADRWTSYCNNTATTISRQDGTGVPGSQYCIRMQRTAGNTTEQAWTLNQGLETTDSIKLRGRKLTLSFYARAGANYSSTDGTMLSTIYSGKGTDQSPWSFTTDTSIGGQPNTLTTTWTKYTLTTTNVVASDITQLRVAFSFTQRGTAGAADYVEIAQVQLCAGDVALPFMPKSFEEELRACQRYYQVLGTASVTYQLGGFDPKIDGASNYRYYFPLTLSPMRADVTGTSFSAAGTSGKATVGDNGIYVGDPANVDTSGSCVLYIPANGRGYGIATHNATFHVLRFYGTFSAEL